jgi:transcriptional regulator with XRE-family HTH domain
MGLGTFKKIAEKVRASDHYVIAKAKLQFGRQIKSLMRKNNLSTKEIALRMKCTSANVSKLVNGEANLRLESMVKLARAAGGEFHFEVKEKESKIDWSSSSSRLSPAYERFYYQTQKSFFDETIRANGANDSIYSLSKQDEATNAA